MNGLRSGTTASACIQTLFSFAYDSLRPRMCVCVCCAYNIIKCPCMCRQRHARLMCTNSHTSVLCVGWVCVHNIRCSHAQTQPRRVAVCVCRQRCSLARWWRRWRDRKNTTIYGPFACTQHHTHRHSHTFYTKRFQRQHIHTHTEDGRTWTNRGERGTHTHAMSVFMNELSISLARTHHIRFRTCLAFHSLHYTHTYNHTHTHTTLLSCCGIPLHRFVAVVVCCRLLSVVVAVVGCCRCADGLRSGVAGADMPSPNTDGVANAGASAPRHFRNTCGSTVGLYVLRHV